LRKTLTSTIRPRKYISDSSQSFLSRRYLHAGNRHQLPVSSNSPKEACLQLKWSEGNSTSFSGRVQLLDFATTCLREHFHYTEPGLKSVEEHSLHLMALTIPVDRFSGVQLMHLEVEVTSRHRQRRQEFPTQRRIAQHENGADCNSADHQRKTILQAPPIAMAEHFIIQIGQRV
jgi:hypothetical protein